MITKRDKCRLCNVSFYLQFHDDKLIRNRLIRGQLTPAYFDRMTVNQKINLRGETPIIWIEQLIKMAEYQELRTWADAGRVKASDSTSPFVEPL